jgi:hypothetical protein
MPGGASSFGTEPQREAFERADFGEEAVEQRLGIVRRAMIGQIVVNRLEILFGPSRQPLRWLEILIGWLFGGALAAMLGALIKKD